MIPLFTELPDTIQPRQGVISVVYTCLAAPACSINVRGFEAEYSEDNGWKKAIRCDHFLVRPKREEQGR